MKSVVYLGLGSNLGDSIQFLSTAILQISKLGAMKVSKLYRSAPMGPQDQPAFYNAVVQVETTLTAIAIMDFAQELEQQAGRVRTRHWGERSLDVDILLIDQQNIQHPRLTVPHAGLFDRNFVLIPMLDIDPEVHYLEQKIADLPAANNHHGIELVEAGDWWRYPV